MRRCRDVQTGETIFRHPYNKRLSVRTYLGLAVLINHSKRRQRPACPPHTAAVRQDRKGHAESMKRKLFSSGLGLAALLALVLPASSLAAGTTHLVPSVSESDSLSV